MNGKISLKATASHATQKKAKGKSNRNAHRRTRNVSQVAVMKLQQDRTIAE
jgi:hypothetical protein